MKHLAATRLRFRRLVLLLAAALGCATAQAQTGLLNDTGQTSCYDASNNASPCNDLTTGDSSPRPHQDGRYGRDPAAAGGYLSKTGGGSGGFDFSCVLWNGTVVNSASCATTLTANTTGTASGSPATDWACTRDNITGLVWSLQTQGPVTWNTATGAGYADAGHNTAARCGYSNGWRLPTRRELLSIVHRGQTSPSIDTTYFPSTPSERYWTFDSDATQPLVFAHAIYFILGNTMYGDKAANTYYVRLVRDGQ